MSDNELFTVKRVAEKLSIRQHGVLTLIKSGEIRASDVSLKPGGRPRWRISPKDLEAFISKRTHQPTSPRRRRRKRRNIKEYF